MPLHRAPVVRPGALSAHGTGGTHSSVSLVFERATNSMDSAWLKDLPGWTAIDVLHRIKSKSFISEDAFFASCVSCVAGRKEGIFRSEEHTSELQSLRHLECRLRLEKKTKTTDPHAGSPPAWPGSWLRR